MKKTVYYILMFTLSLFIFAIIAYLDEQIKNMQNGKIALYFVKQFIIFIYGFLLYVLHKKAFVIKKEMNLSLIIYSMLIFIGNFLASHYYIELYSLSHKFSFIKVILNEDNKIIYNIVAGFLLGIALFKEKKHLTLRCFFL